MLPFAVSSGVVWLVLLYLVVVLIIFAVIFVGGVLVAVVSLPALVVLPTVRRHFVTLAERVWGERFESITNWRFVAVYVIVIDTYGVGLIIGSAMLAEYLSTLEWLLPHGPATLLLELVAVALLGTGLVFVISRATAKPRFRVVGDWVVFLVVVAGLVFVAAVVVPFLLFEVVSLLV